MTTNPWVVVAVVVAAAAVAVVLGLYAEAPSGWYIQFCPSDSGTSLSELLCASLPNVLRVTGVISIKPFWCL